MAHRRKVGNLLALSVLATLTQRPMHPYEMAGLLRARGATIKWGSFYSVVSSLAAHGLVEVAENTREGGRPERTVYRITDAGRGELTDWERELVSTPEPEPSRFKAALSVLGVLGPEEALDLLRRRLAALDEQIAAGRAVLARHLAEVPRLFLIEEEYGLAVREAEAAWVRSLTAELADGAFPGQDGWRAYHETAQIPPDLADLAERGAEP